MYARMSSTWLFTTGPSDRGVVHGSDGLARGNPYVVVVQERGTLVSGEEHFQSVEANGRAHLIGRGAELFDELCRTERAIGLLRANIDVQTATPTLRVRTVATKEEKRGTAFAVLAEAVLIVGPRLWGSPQGESLLSRCET